MQSNPNLGNIFANSKLLPTAEMDALKRTRLDFFGIWKKLLWVWSIILFPGREKLNLKLSHTAIWGLFSNPTFNLGGVGGG